MRKISRLAVAFSVATTAAMAVTFGIYAWAGGLVLALLVAGGKRTRMFGGRVVLILGMAPALMAPLDTTISNNPSMSGEPSNINAGDLGITLSFANVTVSATDSITISETIDLSLGISGGLNDNALILDSTAVAVNGDVTLGLGAVEADTTTLSLNGVFFEADGTTLAGAGQINSGIGPPGASVVQIVGENASFDQAVLFAALAGSVSVLDGQFADVSLDRALSLSLSGSAQASFGSGVLDATDLLAADSSLLTLVGSAFEVDSGGGFMPVGFGVLSDLTGVLRGTLSSGDTFESAFSQGGGAFTGSIVLATPEPSTALLVGAGLLGVAWRRRLV